MEAFPIQWLETFYCSWFYLYGRAIWHDPPAFSHLLVGDGYTAPRPVCKMMQLADPAETFSNPVDHDGTARCDTSCVGRLYIGWTWVGGMQRSKIGAVRLPKVQGRSSLRRLLVAFALSGTDRNPAKGDKICACATTSLGGRFRFNSVRTRDASGAKAKRSVRPPCPVCSCRPIRTHCTERIYGSATNISSNCCSLSRVAAASGFGWAPTFQIACWVGMG